MPISVAGNNAVPRHPREGGDPASFQVAKKKRDPRLREGDEQGFTLVELMVVVTVIGLASGVALWSLPDPRGRVVEEATRLAARTRAARDLAIIDSRPVSLWMTGGGYGFDERIGGRWVPLADKPFRVASWAEGTVAQLGQPQVRVTFDPTGLADRPAEVRLDRDGRGAGVTIGGDGSVAVDG